MKIKFIKSLFDLGFDNVWPVAKPEHLGKAARVRDGEKTIMVILPCGHTATLRGWNITNIDTDTPTATPSIFCKNSKTNPDGSCWHGYLTKGILTEV